MVNISTKMVKIIEKLMFINNLISDNINVIKHIFELIKHKKQIVIDTDIYCIKYKLNKTKYFNANGKARINYFK
jgi:hypothetical protein